MQRQTFTPSHQQVSEEQLFWKYSPSAIAEHDILWQGAPLDQCGSAVSSVSPGSLLPTPCWGDRLRTEIWKLWALFGNS